MSFYEAIIIIMGKENIKEPKQQRSIEKKNKILEVGFRMLCENGYYNTNTAEIAKEAGVSTGIVYRYFPDKKAILLAGFDQLAQKMTDKIVSQADMLFASDDMAVYLDKLIENLVQIHDMFRDTHATFEMLAISEKDVYDRIMSMTETVSSTLTEMIISHDIIHDHVHERIHLIYDMIDNYCHNRCYHPLECIDYEYYKQLTVMAVMHIIKD